MAGIGSYEKGKKFTLKSGNTTPFKKMGSSPVKQKGNPYKGWHPQDIKVDKLATRTDLSKVQFEKKLAKITKTVDPYPSAKKSSMPKDFNIKGGPSKTPGYSSTKMAKNPASTLDRTTKAMQNIPKQFTKATSKNLGKLATGVIKKGVGRLAAGPVAGLAGAAYGAYKSGQKHSGGKAGSKEGQAKWKAQKEKAPKSDIWGKNK